jgi:hypothetical protein
MVHITYHLGMNNRPIEAEVLRRQSHPIIANLHKLISLNTLNKKSLLPPPLAWPHPTILYFYNFCVLISRLCSSFFDCFWVTLSCKFLSRKTTPFPRLTSTPGPAVVQMRVLLMCFTMSPCDLQVRIPSKFLFPVPVEVGWSLSWQGMQGRKAVRCSFLHIGLQSFSYTCTTLLSALYSLSLAFLACLNTNLCVYHAWWPISKGMSDLAAEGVAPYRHASFGLSLL